MIDIRTIWKSMSIGNSIHRDKSSKFLPKYPLKYTNSCYKYKYQYKNYHNIHFEVINKKRKSN
jgi:hypothetical protein